MDWRNTQYTVSCPGIASQPFTLNVHDGKGQAPPSGENKESYEVGIGDQATGDLTGDGRPEAAVLLICHPGASSPLFISTEVQVFTDGPNGAQMLARLTPPAPTTSNFSFPPQFTGQPFFIRSGQLVTGAEYWSGNDSHAAPSMHPILIWQWDGSQFTAQQEGGSSASPEKTTGGSNSEEAAVENAIRGHYAAIGAGDFEKAYSYFGPTLRSQVPEQGWIDSHKAEQIKGTTINSLRVNSVSGEKANANVDVTSQDKTGSSRFLLTWYLVKEDGQWKLDEQASGQKIG